MSDPACPILIGDSAAAMTSLAYTQYSGWAKQTYKVALDKLNDLADYTLNPIAFNASFNPSIALPGFTAPLAPTAPTVTYNPPANFAPPPVLNVPGAYVPSAQPVDTTVAPTYNDIAPPVLAYVPTPGTAPTLITPEFPTAPTPEFPTLPSLVALNLPTPPNITLPTFQGERPVFDVPIPVENFSFTPTDYSSASLTLLTASIDNMLTNPVGLPAAVAQALRDRASVEADNTEFRTIQSAYDEFADRGFFEPNGMLHRRIFEARQAGIVSRGVINRDVYVQDAQTAIENLKFAIQQGVNLEGKLIDQHVSFMQMQLEAAKYQLDAAISIFNARVTAFNAQTQAYQVDAAVFRDLIDAQNTILEVYKAELDGQRLIGEINQQTVALYTAQLQGVQTLVDVYRAQVQAVATEVDANKTQIEAYSATVSAYSEQLRAQSIQLQVYTSQLDAENTKAKLYEISSQVYATRVSAWAEGEKTNIDGKRLTLEYDDTRLKQWSAQVQAYETQLKAELQRIQSVGEIFNIQADLYKAESQVTVAASDANDRAFQLNLAQEQAIVDVELKRADRDFEQFRFISQQLEDKLKTIAQIAAQLTASSMSAVNFHAGVSSSLSQSYGCSTSISYSGSIDNSTPVDG